MRRPAAGHLGADFQRTAVLHVHVARLDPQDQEREGRHVRGRMKKAAQLRARQLGHAHGQQHHHHQKGRSLHSDAFQPLIGCPS